MVESFTKSDLKTGMIVTCRNGEEYIVFLQASINNLGDRQDLLINNNGYNGLDIYADDLYDYDLFDGIDDKGFKKDPYDIMKVEQPDYPSAIFESCNRTLLWERNEEPEKITLTISEVFEMLREEYSENKIIEIKCNGYSITSN